MKKTASKWSCQSLLGSIKWKN